MGAYENPPIIQQPNLSDIWNRNFRAAQEATAKAFAPAIEFKKEEAKRKAIRDNTVAKLRQEAGNTKPALTSYVIKKVDELAKETARYNKEKSDSERFLKFQAQSFSAVDKIKNTGSALAAFSKNLSEKNISNFQSKESAKTLGFLDAFNNQRFTDIKEDENGSLNIGFSNPFDGESLYMTEAEYTDENSYKINEVFDPTETIETGVDLLKSKLSNEKNIFKYDLKDGFGEGSTKQQLWEDPKLKDPKNRINFVSNSSFMKQLTTQELGSYIEDNIRKKQKDLSTDEDYLEVTKDLTKEQKRVVDYYAKSSFINEEITLLSGDKINPANYMEAMAKLKIAKDIVNEGPQATRTTEISTVSGGDNEKEAKRKEQLNTAMPIIGNIKVPRDSDGRVDVGDSSFYNELARLNLAVDKAGFFESKDDKIIAVKSNITNKSLNITGEMNDLDVKNALMLLSGATTKEADKAYPIKKGLGVQENLFSEELSTGNLPTN